MQIFQNTLTGIFDLDIVVARFLKYNYQLSSTLVDRASFSDVGSKVENCSNVWFRTADQAFLEQLAPDLSVNKLFGQMAADVPCFHLILLITERYLSSLTLFQLKSELIHSQHSFPSS